MAQVSVVIVTWNNEADIEGCLQSVMEDGEKCEIICVDNNSSDRTLEVMQRLTHLHRGASPLTLQVHKNNTNVGFTKAVNQGVKQARGDFVFLLNPDTTLKEGCLKTLYDFLNRNNDYAACCPKLFNEDGSIQYSVRSFPTYIKMFFEFTLLSKIFSRTKLFGGWKMEYFDYGKDSDIQQPMAAALMLRKSAAEMDERFEMFFNDVDLCKRVLDRGQKIRYVSGAEAIHKKGTSVGRDRVRMIKIWCRDCLKYFEKHHRNRFLLVWLRINLKVSEIIRILGYKIGKFIKL
jgi:GT2 family glycosyltransferase